MYLICGLGNPGKKYEKTRHNAGYAALDALGRKTGIEINRSKFQGRFGEGRIGGERVILLKPETYMNLSGRSVREAAAFYKIEPAHILVVYDDFDIPLGSIRIRKFGSAGTHNGMRSIVQELGSDRFPRVRIGTGTGKEGDLISFVVGKVPEEEMRDLEKAAEEAADACEMIVSEDIDLAMNRFNTRKNSREKDE